MLKSGDQVKVIKDISKHGFEIGETVYFLGVTFHLGIFFICTDGKNQQGLREEEFELIYEQ